MHPIFILQILLLIFLSGARRVRWRCLEVLAAASQAKRSTQHLVFEAQCIRKYAVGVSKSLPILLPLILSSPSLCAVGLRLSVDSYQPFEKTIYSMTPIFLEVLGLPAHLRLLVPFQILVALVPGPTEISNDQWFRICEAIVNELQQLFDGVFMDVIVPGMPGLQRRLVQAVLVMTTFDSPAGAKVRCHSFVSARLQFTMCKCPPGLGIFGALESHTHLHTMPVCLGLEGLRLGAPSSHRRRASGGRVGVAARQDPNRAR